MPESDPTRLVTKEEAFAWLDKHPDAGPRDFCKAMAAVHRATPEQMTRLETRVNVWRHRDRQKAAKEAAPTNLHSLPPPSHHQDGAQGQPDPATAGPVEVAEWLTRQAFDAVALGARAPGYAAILKAAKEAHADLLAARLNAAPTAADLTIAEICDRLESEVREVPESLLDVCVVEWARRKGLRVAADDRGRPTLLRATG